MEKAMAGRNKLQLLGLLLVAAAVTAVPGRSAAAAVAIDAAATLQCGDVINALVPCGPFLLGVAAEKNPSARCCHSAQALNQMGSTVELRRQLCRCLTQTGPSFGVVPERANRLPSLCKLNLTMPVSATIDCNTVH